MLSRVITNFLPSLLVPQESILSTALASNLLLASIVTLTYPKSYIAVVFRVIFGLGTIYFSYDVGFGGYTSPNLDVEKGMVLMGVMGIMRAFEICFISFGDESPPYWITDGKPVPLPTTVGGRLLYALDLLSSIRGTSWCKNTTWSWAPRALRDTPSPSRTRFIAHSFRNLIIQYIMLDAFDTLNHSREWPHPHVVAHPITSLPFLEQLVFSFSVCACTALRITIPATVISLLAVLLGSHPSSWPPMFNAPFTASSLQDFWTHRWHAIFRRTFDRLASCFLYIFIPRSIIPQTSIIRKVIRSSIIFGLSASFHLLLIYETYHPSPISGMTTSHTSTLEDTIVPLSYTFFDPSTLKFFLSQPLGLLIERALIIPFSNLFPSGSQRMFLRRAFAWSWLLYSGRWWSDAWVRGGHWGPEELAVGWSPIRGLLKGEWYL